MTTAKPSERTGTLIFKLILYGVLTGACMYMIYWFSSQEGGASSELSEKVAKAIAAIIYVGFDTFGATEKLEILQNLSFNVRKVAHFSEFALLGSLLTATLWQLVQLIGKERCSVILTAFLSLIASVAYAASDEYHQLFVSGRAGDIKDVFIDGSGALLGILIVSFFIALGTIGWRRRISKEGSVSKTVPMPRV